MNGCLNVAEPPDFMVSRRPPNTVERAHSASIPGPNSPLENTPHNTGNGEISITCADRHCPKCQSLARAEWLEKRRSELLQTQYFHVVFTVPEQIAPIAYQNKKVVYGILFRATAETLRTIAADPKHLGAEIGFFAVLHSWGQNLLHHPHLHCVVAGGGLSPDGTQWISCRPGFFLPVRVLSRLFRRLFLDYLLKAFDAGKLDFFSSLEPLRERGAFLRHLAPTRAKEWVVYAKRPFAGPEQVLDYVGRYTHRVAISNNRLLDIDQRQGHFPLQGLSPGQSAEDDDAGRGGIYPPLPTARTAQWLPAHPLLRLPRQPLPRTETGPLPPTAGYASL